MRQGQTRNGALVVRSATWVRILFWLTFAVGGLCLLAGLASVLSGQWGLVVLLVVGLLPTPVGWLGARTRVRCDRRGINYRSFRSTFVPLADIDHLEVAPVDGAGPVSRAQVAVVRRDGSTVRLDPTEVVRSGPQHDAVRTQIATMYRSLGLGEHAWTDLEP